MEQVTLYEETQKLLCRVACEWVGIKLKEDEVDKRTNSLASLFESAAAAGPAYWTGRKSRNSLNDWIGELIDGIRNGKIDVPSHTILYQFTMHRVLEGEVFDRKMADVEIIILIIMLHSICNLYIFL